MEAWLSHLPNTWAGNTGLLAVIAVALFVLVKSADVLVEGAVSLARSLGIPPLIIGATIVSLGTTSPEAAVSVLAALRGAPGLAIGNGVGSLICDLALILGGCMLTGTLPLGGEMVKRQSRIVLAAAALFAIFAYVVPGSEIRRWMGFVLVGCLVLYLYVSFRWARSHQGDPGEAIPAPAGEGSAHHPPTWLAVVMVFGGLGFLLGASHVLIPCVELAATRAGIPEAVIAATLVAFGTSLPELMTAITSIRKGHPELVLGNILGADALNILFVIGVSASAVPLRLEPAFFWVQGPVMLFVLLLFQVYLVTTRGTFRRWQGGVMVLSYVAFILASVFAVPHFWPSVG